MLLRLFSPSAALIKLSLPFARAEDSAAAGKVARTRALSERTASARRSQPFLSDYDALRDLFSLCGLYHHCVSARMAKSRAATAFDGRQRLHRYWRRARTRPCAVRTASQKDHASACGAPMLLEKFFFLLPAYTLMQEAHYRGQISTTAAFCGRYRFHRSFQGLERVPDLV